DVLNHGRVGGGIIVRSRERPNRASFHGKRLHGSYDVRLQLEDFWRRLCANAGYALRGCRGIVVLEGIQPHRSQIGTGKDIAGGGVNFVEIRSANKTLNQRNVRTMRCVEGEALREYRQQT